MIEAARIHSSESADKASSQRPKPLGQTNPFTRRPVRSVAPPTRFGTGSSALVRAVTGARTTEGEGWARTSVHPVKSRALYH
jgi:hypothetical protein